MSAFEKGVFLYGMLGVVIIIIATKPNNWRSVSKRNFRRSVFGCFFVGFCIASVVAQ